MTEQLKACPRCGDEIEIVPSLGFKTTLHVNNRDCKYRITASEDADIIATWNARPIEDAQAATIAELQSELVSVRAALEGNERQREIDQNHFALVEKHLNDELVTLRADAVTARIAAEMAANKISDQARLIADLKSMVHLSPPGGTSEDPIDVAMARKNGGGRSLGKKVFWPLAERAWHLRERCARMVKALEWYANKDNYSAMDWDGNSIAKDDEGERARAALKDGDNAAR